MSKMDLESEVEFFSRVVNLPLVNSAIGYASGAYYNAKESSPQLIRKTLCKAEDTAKFAAQLAVPVIHSLERPIHVVDALACKTLDKMEDSLPAMTQTPEQIIEKTSCYVSEKLQPVHNKVDLVYNIANMFANRLLDNPYGNFLLTSMQSTVSKAHSCIDYYIPPIAADAAQGVGMRKEVVPKEASEKIVWTIRRSLDIPLKVRRRVSSRTERRLHDLGAIGLTYTGNLINLVEWGQLNLKEAQTFGLSGKLHLMAVQYADKSGQEQPSTMMGDVVVLLNALSRQTVELIRTSVNYSVNLPDSEPVKALRAQLYLALNVLLDFVSRVITTFQSSSFLDDTGRFNLQSIIRKAMVIVQQFNKQLLWAVSRMKISL